MERPNDNLFSKEDRHVESTLIRVIKLARKNSGQGTEKIIDQGLDELYNLYRLIYQRAGS